MNGSESHYYAKFTLLAENMREGNRAIVMRVKRALDGNGKGRLNV